MAGARPHLEVTSDVVLYFLQVEDVMKRFVIPVVLVLAVLLLAGCAAGPNSAAGTPDGNGDVAGFWMGLWHGFIVLFSFILSLFRDGVEVYEVHNNGGWYNFGFLLGVMTFFGSGSQGACRGKRRR